MYPIIIAEFIKDYLQPRTLLNVGSQKIFVEIKDPLYRKGEKQRLKANKAIDFVNSGYAVYCEKTD